MTDPDALIGQTVSHYHILAKIGEGGMGTVYRAQDLRLGREAALKFLAAGMAVDRAARKHLLREAQAASRLNHPNIATIYEVNDSEALPFIAMELVSGESLKQFLQRSALVPGQLVDIARQVAEGLQEAHRAGVFHRDIKPGNIMVSSKLRVKILDFGLAVLVGRERVMDETVDAFLTRSSIQHTFSGTLPYMSPEQLRGEQTDARNPGIRPADVCAGHRH
jgi:serine/threonine protein kinase